MTSLITDLTETVVFDLKVKKGYCNLHKFDFVVPDHPLQPRDTAGVYGDTLVDFYTGNNGRFFSNWSTYDYFVDYYKLQSSQSPSIKSSP